jgi:hypothetical protein
MNKIVLAIILLFSYGHSFCQHRVPLVNNSFKGAIEFLPNSKLSEGFNKVKCTSFEFKDPKVDPRNWYQKNDASMRGFVEDFVLFFEWWTIQELPTEAFKMEWKNSGFFELLYKEDGAFLPTSAIIYRSQLGKYPNLLQRFDDLMPLSYEIEYTFRNGHIPDQDYWNFRRKHSILEDLGSAGYSITYTRKIDHNTGWLSKSGEKQRFSPWLSPNGWEGFLNFDPKYNDKKSRLIELFKINEEIAFSSIKITKIEWNISEFIYIAKKYKEYESGKDKPEPEDEVADSEVPNKAGGDFWDDTDVICNEIIELQEYSSTTNQSVIQISGTIKNCKSQNIVLTGMGYSQEVSVKDGIFNTKIVLKSGNNNIKIKSKCAEKNIVVNLDRKKVKLRATLVWNTSNTDIDLHMNSNGYNCYYQNKNAGDMRLDVDNTQGFGPENIYVEFPKGEYNISLVNYTKRGGTIATVYIFVDEELIHKEDVRFDGINNSVFIKKVPFN